MEMIRLSVESFKFLIYNRFLPVFDEEINMDIVEDLLSKYEYISINKENCVFGMNEGEDGEKEFIKHKSNAYILIQKIVEKQKKSYSYS